MEVKTKLISRVQVNFNSLQVRDAERGCVIV